MTESEEQGNSGQQEQTPTVGPDTTERVTDSNTITGDRDNESDHQPNDHPSQQFGENLQQEVKRQWQPKPRSESKSEQD